MKNEDLFNESNQATYCPEDDKLRLYVGRVPREEYLALKEEGWTSTPKQDCDFVAVWSVAREDTALSYAGVILDEDQGPEDRAADRAERFSGYLEKRLGEAIGHADRYESGPSAYGNQNAARAERSAGRRDRIGARAVNAWDRAEYWQRRTAGVIDSALYKSSPGVRMGRIKTIEAEERKAKKIADDFALEWGRWVRVLNESDPVKQTELARHLSGTVSAWGKFPHPRDESRTETLWDLLREEKPDPITGAEAAELWIGEHCPPDHEAFRDTPNQRFLRHCQLRLAYENQMLQAEGGRAAFVEMEVGGFIGGHQIYKVNKSPATGRVVSVAVKIPTHGHNKWGNPYPEGTDPVWRYEQINIERLPADAYRPGTEEEIAALKAEVKAAKDARPAAPPCPLVNPTLADAQRLQDLINAAHLAEWIRRHGEPKEWHKPKDGKEVTKVKQETYSEASKGEYARAETREVCGGGAMPDRSSNLWTSGAAARRAAMGPAICKVRVTGYDPVSVIHLTDKPCKPFPAAVWEAFKPETVEP